jgi:hypothetical protein
MGRLLPQGLKSSRKGAGRYRYHRNKAAQGISSCSEGRWHHENNPLVLQDEGIIVLKTEEDRYAGYGNYS